MMEYNLEMAGQQDLVQVTRAEIAQAWQLMQKQVIDVLQIPSERVEMYQDLERREYINNGGEDAKRFLVNTTAYQVAHQDEAQLIMVIGDVCGTSKSGRSSQLAAERMFNRRGVAEVYKKTGKLPLDHYFAIGIGLEMLWDEDIIDRDKHPYYNPREYALMDMFPAAFLSYMLCILPLLYPGFLHRVICEYPYPTIGPAMTRLIQSRHTAVDFALTNDRAQDDSADLRESQSDPVLFTETQEKMNVVADKVLKPDDVRGYTGNRETRDVWRRRVDELMSKHLEIPLEQLINDSEFRNTVALKKYVEGIEETVWNIHPDLRITRPNTYLPDDKHFNYQLIFRDVRLGNNKATPAVPRPYHLLDCAKRLAEAA